MKIKNLFDLLLLILIINKTSNICIPGDNCPTNSGFCKLDICECLPGYKTLINENDTNSLFCNYKQYSKWIPFILEIFFPSIGLFYIQRIFHGFIKLALFIPIIWGTLNTPVILILIFITIYISDLVCLYFLIYQDGNGISLY